jgi:hypothetical protein
VRNASTRVNLLLLGRTNRLLSRSRSSKFLLALVSTVVLGCRSPLGPMAKCLLQETEIGYPRRGELGAKFVAPSAPALTQRSGKGICTLRRAHKLCHFTAMNNTYTYRGHLSMQTSTADHALTYFISPKWQLVT